MAQRIKTVAFFVHSFQWRGEKLHWPVFGENRIQIDIGLDLFEV
jgi:hypothetical protein